MHVQVHVRMHMRNVQWKPGACHGTPWSEGCVWREVRAGWRSVGAAAPVPRGPWHAAAPSKGGRLPAPLARWSGGAHGTARRAQGAAGGRVGAWGDAWVVRMSGIWAHSSGSLAFFISSRVTFISVASHGEHVRGRCGGARAGPTLTGRVPGRGGIGPNSSRAALRPSSSALGPAFKVYAAVSSAMAAGAA